MIQTLRYKPKKWMEVVRLTCMGVMLWLGCGTASFSIEDIVLHKESGKDGYTAIIQTKGGRKC